MRWRLATALAWTSVTCCAPVPCQASANVQVMDAPTPGSSEPKPSRASDTSSSGAGEEGTELAPGLASVNGSVSGGRASLRARVKEEAADERDEPLTGLSKQELKRAQNRRIQHRFREKERVRARLCRPCAACLPCKCSSPAQGLVHQPG